MNKNFKLNYKLIIKSKIIFLFLLKVNFVFSMDPDLFQKEQQEKQKKQENEEQNEQTKQSKNIAKQLTNSFMKQYVQNNKLLDYQLQQAKVEENFNLSCEKLENLKRNKLRKLFNILKSNMISRLTEKNINVDTEMKEEFFTRININLDWNLIKFINDEISNIEDKYLKDLKSKTVSPCGCFSSLMELDAISQRLHWLKNYKKTYIEYLVNNQNFSNFNKLAWKELIDIYNQKNKFQDSKIEDDVKKKLQPCCEFRKADIEKYISDIEKDNKLKLIFEENKKQKQALALKNFKDIIDNQIPIFEEEQKMLQNELIEQKNLDIEKKKLENQSFELRKFISEGNFIGKFDEISSKMNEFNKIEEEINKINKEQESYTLKLKNHELNQQKKLKELIEKSQKEFNNMKYELDKIDCKFLLGPQTIAVQYQNNIYKFSKNYNSSNKEFAKNYTDITKYFLNHEYEEKN